MNYVSWKKCSLCNRQWRHREGEGV